MTMNRRTFLRRCGVAGMAGGAALLAGADSDANAQSRERKTPVTPAFPAVEWRLATSWTPALDLLQGASELLAARVAALTNGQFRIQVSAAGELMPALDVFDGVQQGTIECAHTAVFYFIEKNEVFAIATGLPFGLTPQQQNVWLYGGGGLDALQSAFADFGMLHLPGGGTGTQMGGWLRREVSTLDDLQGFRFRIPGLGGRVMQRLGVETMVIPGGEILSSFEADEIDGAEWIGPYDDEKLELHKAAPYYYYPGWWEPGSSLGFLVNQRAWDALPPMYREIFVSAAHQVNLSILSRYEVQNQQALVRLVAGGTQLRPYSDEIMEAAKEAAFELYEETASANPSFRDVFGPWKEFRRQIYQWNRFNELNFALFAAEHL